MKGLKAPDKEIIDYLAKKQLDDEEPRNETAVALLKSATECIKLIDDLKLILIHNKTELNFIASDNPVVMENEFQREYGVGFDSIGIWFLIPISAKYSILMIDSKLYPKCQDVDEFVITREDEVEKFNNIQYMNCREILYSFDKKPLEKVKLVFEIGFDEEFLIEIRQTVRERLKPQYRDIFLLNYEVEKEIKNNNYLETAKSILSPHKCVFRYNAQMDFLSLHQRAIPFAQNINLSFTRHRTLREVHQRLQLISIGSKITGERKEKNNYDAQGYNEFLLDYFNNKL